MKKIIVGLLLGVSFMFAALNLNTATKDELMSIKGIGPKKAEQIIEYRKKQPISNADELSTLKGFGKGVIENIKSNKLVAQKKREPKKSIKK